MKKTWLKFLATAMAVVTVGAFAACSGGNGGNGGNDDPVKDDPTPNPPVVVEKTQKEKILEYIESLNEEKSEGTNAFSTSFDDMVKYLQEKNVISSSATPVDINATAGYLKKYDGTYEDVQPVADKAFDYDGVWLFWWDIAGGSEYASTYGDLAINKSIVVGGGMYTMPVTECSGSYAITFKSVADTEKNYRDWNGEEDWNEYTAGKDAAIEEAKKQVKTQLDAFKAIDATAPSMAYYTSINDLATKLQKQGYITIQQLASPVDLNKEYSYPTTKRDWVGYEESETGWSEYYDTTATVQLASTANKYGAISVYYYDTISGLYSPVSDVYDNLKKNNTIGGFAKLSANAEYVEYKCTGTTYDENGKAIAVKPDFFFGSFAVVVDDSVND